MSSWGAGARQVFLRAGTRALFSELSSLQEIGRRVLGRIDADFSVGERGNCRQLVRNDWQALIVALDRPEFAELARELAARIESHSRDRQSKWFAFDLQTGSNSIEFTDGKHFLLDRPLAEDSLGWFGSSAPAEAPATAGIVSRRWQEFEDAVERVVRPGGDPKASLVEFYAAYCRLGNLLSARLESVVPAIAEDARRQAGVLLERIPRLEDPRQERGIPAAVVAGWKEYQATMRILREKLQRQQVVPDVD